jgi:hypothetical protein
MPDVLPDVGDERMPSVLAHSTHGHYLIRHIQATPSISHDRLIVMRDE